MNALTNRGSSAVAALSSLKAGLQNVATSIVSVGGDPFLRLLKDGSWVYGAENIEVEENSEWAINPLSLTHGWVAWTDYKKKANEVMGEVMVPAGQPLPLQSELRALVDEEGNKLEWRQQLSVQFQCMSGEDIGTQVMYKATSVGGMNASKDLINAIMRQLETDIDNPVPVILLHADNYTHKTWGKTYFPVFKIVDWVPLDDAIKAPIESTPDSDTTAEAAPAEAQQVRSRGGATGQTQAAPDNTTITPEDRKAALDHAMAETAQQRAAERQAARASAPAEEAAPRRRQRR